MKRGALKSVLNSSQFQEGYQQTFLNETINFHTATIGDSFEIGTQILDQMEAPAWPTAYPKITAQIPDNSPLRGWNKNYDTCNCGLNCLSPHKKTLARIPILFTPCEPSDDLETKIWQHLPMPLILYIISIAHQLWTTELRTFYAIHNTPLCSYGGSGCLYHTLLYNSIWIYAANFLSQSRYQGRSEVFSFNTTSPDNVRHMHRLITRDTVNTKWGGGGSPPINVLQNSIGQAILMQTIIDNDQNMLRWISSCDFLYFEADDLEDFTETQVLDLYSWTFLPNESSYTSLNL